MKQSQKPDHLTLANIVDRLRDGWYVIPDFQRDFEWAPGDINELMRSIFRDYHIGSLLLWKGTEHNFDSLSCQPIYAYTSKGHRDQIVLDGQQRLTAMYYAFMAPDFPAPKRRNRFLYFIRVDEFMAENHEEAFVYYWTRYGVQLLEDRVRQFDLHMFPLVMIGADWFDLVDWLRDYEQHWRNLAATDGAGNGRGAEMHAQRARAFAQHIRELTQQYQISYIELDKDLPLDKVCDIFTQLNRRGVRLDIFDLLNALLRPKGIRLRQELWSDASTRLELVESDRLNVYVLQVMSVLLQSYCSPKYIYHMIPGTARQLRAEDGSLYKKVLVGDADQFKSRWNQAVDSLEYAIGLLSNPQEFGAVSSQYLPYAAMLPAFAALQEKAKLLPEDRRLGAQRKIRMWYWASVFTGRYSGAVESTTARDYVDVRHWFERDDAQPSFVDEFRQAALSLDLKGETRRGTSVYNGAFNLLMIRGARDWISGTIPQAGDLDDHHIVPKSLGDKLEADTSIDSILNRTPLTAAVNRGVIGDKLPNEYLPELIKDAGEETVTDILESHLITRDAMKILLRKPFAASDYEEFVEARQKEFRKKIRELAEL